jgi:diadenosine tetraphosphate (Ap4A) HIT family hydrolase
MPVGGGDKLQKLIMKMARNPASGALVGWAFAHLHAVLPVRRLVSTDRVLAFHHPRPSWETHVLLVPKRRVRSLVGLANPDHVHLFEEILAAADVAVEALGLSGSEHVLCANGGPRQEVGQVHFHLFTGERYVSAPAGPPQVIIYEDADVVAYHHPAPQWAFHLVIEARDGVAPAPLAMAAAHLVCHLLLEEHGYTLVVADGGRGYGRCAAVHLISGRKL